MNLSFLSLYPISGEVYEISESELDNLEGNGKWYTRRVKNNIKVQAYFNENAQQHTGIFQA